MKTKKLELSDKPEIVIHIGLPKTGSSAIQKFCAEHTEWLATQGYYYPSHKTDVNGISGGHSKFFTALRDQQLEQAKDFIEKNLKIAKQKGLILLVSSEGLTYEPERTSDLLSCYDYKIIGFCRHPLDYYFSAYNQMVKRHYQTASVEFHADFMTKNLRKYVFAELLTEWKERVGDNINILPYSSDHKGKHSVLDTFFKFLKCDIDYVSEHRETRTINGAYCHAALELKRLLNNVLNEQDTKLNTKIDAELQNVSDQKQFQKGSIVSRLSEQAYQDLGAKYEKAIKQIEGLFDFSFYPAKQYKKGAIPTRQILSETIILVEHLEKSLPREMSILRKRIHNNDWENVDHDQVRLCELFDCLIPPSKFAKDVFFSPQIIRHMPNYKEVDFFREMAKLFWERGDIETAFSMISKAYELRKNGPVIKQLYLDIKQAYELRNAQ